MLTAIRRPYYTERITNGAPIYYWPLQAAISGHPHTRGGTYVLSCCLFDMGGVLTAHIYFGIWKLSYISLRKRHFIAITIPWIPVGICIFTCVMMMMMKVGPYAGLFVTKVYQLQAGTSPPFCCKQFRVSELRVTRHEAYQLYKVYIECSQYSHLLINCTLWHTVPSIRQCIGASTFQLKI